MMEGARSFWITTWPLSDASMSVNRSIYCSAAGWNELRLTHTYSNHCDGADNKTRRTGFTRSPWSCATQHSFQSERINGDRELGSFGRSFLRGLKAGKCHTKFGYKSHRKNQNSDSHSPTQSIIHVPLQGSLGSRTPDIRCSREGWTPLLRDLKTCVCERVTCMCGEIGSSSGSRLFIQTL